MTLLTAPRLLVKIVHPLLEAATNELRVCGEGARLDAGDVVEKYVYGLLGFFD
jgi:uncharacterized protein YjeT (DUF2065 family)